MDLKNQSRSAHAEGRGLEGAFKICAVALWEMFCLIMFCLVNFFLPYWFLCMYHGFKLCILIGFVSACVCFLFYSPDLFHCDLILSFSFFLFGFGFDTCFLYVTFPVVLEFNL